MGPRDWIETIKEVLKKIGNTGDTGGSQTAGTVFGKENAILDILKNGGMPMVKSVQRGTAILCGGDSSDSTSITVNISAVNTAKCIILLSGDSTFQLYTTTEGTIYGARAEFISDTKLKILETYNKYVNEINWQVVEFY